MKISIDFHCHIYEVYNLRNALKFAGQPDGQPRVLFLTERYDCHFFEQINSKPDLPLHDISTEKIDQNCIKVGKNLFLIRGRQFACKEGIEVLSLFVSPELPDGLEAREYCRAITAENGVIAFSWAFGKWRGLREPLIEKLCLESGNNKTVLLDSRLRPGFMRLPGAFKRLSEKGFKVYAGSDPLPLGNNENKLASFYTIFEVGNDTVINSTSIREIIFNSEISMSAGQRTCAWEFIRDQLLLRLSPHRKK